MSSERLSCASCRGDDYDAEGIAGWKETKIHSGRFPGMETLHEKPLCGDCLSFGFDLVSLSEPDFILVGGILMFTH